MIPPLGDLLRRALRRPRNRVLLGLLLLAVGLRIALPYLLRPQIVSRADAALVGRIALADLDLSLLRGGVTLHGLEVYADELPLAAALLRPTPAPESKPPLFAAKRLWTQISWLALLGKTIEVEELELEGFVVRLDRLMDGILLPKPVPSEEPEEPEPEQPSSWSFAADSVALRDGQIFFRDFTVGEEPQRFDLAVKDLSARQLALVIDPTGREPGHVVISAQIGEGALGLDAQVESRAGGPAAFSKIAVSNLPIGGVRVYLKMFGWSDLTGTLDAKLEHRFETKGAHEIAGSLALSDVVVNVPELDRPALAWKTLGIGLEKIDLIRQDAAVSKVALEGARLVVDPRSDVPVPLATPRAGAPAGAPAEQEAATAASTAPEAGASRPWTWRVAIVRIAGSSIDVRGSRADASARARRRAARSGERSGRPFAAEALAGLGQGIARDRRRARHLPGRLRWKAPDLGPRSPAAARVHRRAGRGPAAPGQRARGSGDRARAARLRRKQERRPRICASRARFGLAGIDVGEPKTAKEFGAAWKDLEVGIRELAVPGVIGASDAGKPPEIGRAPRSRAPDPARVPHHAHERGDPAPAARRRRAGAPRRPRRRKRRRPRRPTRRLRARRPRRRSGSRSRTRESRGVARRSSTGPCSPSTTPRSISST